MSTSADEEVKRSTLTTLEARLVDLVLDLTDGVSWEISTAVFHTAHVGVDAAADTHRSGRGAVWRAD